MCRATGEREDTPKRHGEQVRPSDQVLRPRGGPHRQAVPQAAGRSPPGPQLPADRGANQVVAFVAGPPRGPGEERVVAPDVGDTAGDRRACASPWQRGGHAARLREGDGGRMDES